MSDDANEEEQRANYVRGVIIVLQEYGRACEGFGRASEGSPRGMEGMMRLAHDAAYRALYAFLGREPTLQELEQIPPLYEQPAVNLSLDQLSVEPPKGKPRKRPIQ